MGEPTAKRLDWLDPLRGFALMGILLNHLVEEFGPGPWFTNPSNRWPDLTTRMGQLWPAGQAPWLGLVRWLGWLGDSGPGVFLLVSGVGLTYAARRSPTTINAIEFYRRRLLRIFPLYWLMHFVILGAALLVPGSRLGFADQTTLVSLLGLRVTDGSFFAISPSWWFVWLILQCYLVFPLLLRLLDRVGPIRFGVLTLGLTLAARGWGLLYSDSLYYWMTGQFAGTRLAEFAAGMLIGHWLAQGQSDAVQASRPARLLAGALPVYLLGVAASFTWTGSLVSNILVTLGLTGIGVAFWRGVCSRHVGLARAATWTGVASFPVFLLHQPLLEWTTVAWPGNTSSHVAAALGVLILSFPLGVMLERVTALLPRMVRTTPATIWHLLLASGSLAGLILLVGLEPDLVDPLWRRTMAWLLAVLAAALLLDRIRPEPVRGVGLFLSDGALVGSLVFLAALPPRSGALAGLVGLLSAAALTISRRMLHRPVLAVCSGGLITVAVLGAAEAALWQLAPMEAGGWGERAALQIHPTRVYSLIPNKVTRLRYNDYDYVVRTNSEGLPGPEISPERAAPNTFRLLVTGDAFTMPEGLPYQASWPALLEERLAKCLTARQVQTISAGVTGYGPLEELAQLRELVPRYRPDVVVVQFFVNDFADVLVTPGERHRSIGLTARFPSRRQRLVDGSQLAHRVTSLRQAAFEQAQPVSRATIEDQSLLRYYRRGSTPLYSPETLERLRSTLAGMRGTANQAGATLLITFVPAAIAVTQPGMLPYDPGGVAGRDSMTYDFMRPLRELVAVATPLGIPVHDLGPALRSHPVQPVYYPTAWHWNSEGHQAAARGVLLALANQRVIPRECAP